MEQNIHYTSLPSTGIEALSCASDFAFPKHVHSGHVIWLNSRGAEHFEVRNSKKILQPGTISIIEPFIAHSNKPAEPSARHLRSLYLNHDFLSTIEEYVRGYNLGKTELGTTVIDTENVYKAALHLHDSLLNSQQLINMQEKTLYLFEQFTSFPIRQMFEKENARGMPGKMKAMIEFMRNNLDSDINLADLAAMADCTVFHVIRLFKKRLGMSPHAYLVQLRLEKAKQLLDANNSIADTAFLSGFSDQSHLTRNFKKRYGIPPGKYCKTR